MSMTLMGLLVLKCCRRPGNARRTLSDRRTRDKPVEQCQGQFLPYADPGLEAPLPSS